MIKEEYMTQDELLSLIDQAEAEKWSELDLGNKVFVELPPQIGRLTQLEKLQLGIKRPYSSAENRRLTLPPEIGALTNLTELNLDSRILKKLPPEIKYLTNLTTLNLEHTALRELPPEIGYMTGLKEFAISNGSLQSVPSEVANLTNLISLTIETSDLMEFPPEIFSLTNLRYLSLCLPQVNKLPSGIVLLTNLVALGFSSKQYHRFNAETGEIHSAVFYHRLNNTQTKVLSSEIFELSELTFLDISANNLKQLPPEIGQLTNLTTLDIRYNQLSEIPLTLLSLTKAQNFYVQHPEKQHVFLRGFVDSIAIDANLRFPPEEVLGLGSQAITNYLIATQLKSQYVWESKCLLVGEGGVGKTCLYNVLNGRLCKEYEEGTVGIEIGSLNLPHPEKLDITMHLNCWDFAGQDFNHAMHQFFFSNRALFLLIWNARHGWQQGKLYRWLENIKVRAPEAKVILVSTHIDQPSSDYPAADLQTKYPQIVATIEVSSKTGENIQGLRDLICQHAADLPMMGLRWPQTWLDAANAVRTLREQGHKHASRREVVNVIKEHNLNDEESNILMRWMHELGDILYFDDEPDMRGRVILDPEWLTKHIGIVLRSDEVATQYGILTRSHLNKLWPDLDDYLQDHFLRLMDKFDLAYLIPNDPEDRSLIVERLPLDPPDYESKWAEFRDAGNEITLRFKLGSMQPGIPTWFIARCHRFTMETHWLNGVMFRDEDDRHRALVIADDQYNTVQMTVRGPFPQRFMSLLRDGFRDTLKRYKGLEVTRWVPCPGYNELEERPCHNEFRLDNLESWLEKKPDRITFSCPECDTELSRLQLVEGIGAAALTQSLTEKRIIEVIREEGQLVRQVVESEGEETRLHMSAEIDNLIKYHERNFLRAFYLDQERELVTCPNLFTLRRVPKKGVVKKQEWHIQLYCQQPGDWHPVGDPYIIEEQKEWFNKALPYLKTLFKVLSVVAPLAGAALAVTDVAGDKVAWARRQQEIFANEIKMMDALLKGTKAVTDLQQPLGEHVQDMPEHATFRKHEGADLVAIRTLMDQLAEIDDKKGRLKWAGLTRRQTPEGDILWLDEEHLQEYLSKRPVTLPPANEQ